MTGSLYLRIRTWVFGLSLIVMASAAQAVEVNSGLSENLTVVGRAIQFQIQIQGAVSADVPNHFAVDGLDIRFANQSSQAQFQLPSFQRLEISTYTFLVTPEREGKYTIPSLSIEVDGKTYRTQPQSFKVVKPNSNLAPPVSQGPGQGQRPVTPQQLAQFVQQMQQQAQQQLQQMQQQMQQQGVPVPSLPGFPAPPSQPGVPPPSSQPDPATPPDEMPPLEKLATVQLVIPERKVFVGQSVPVEIRLFLDARYRINVPNRPDFGAEGFTAEKLSEPKESSQTINGVPYYVFSFKTAITPLKAGPLTIPAAKFDAAVLVPTGRDFFGGLVGEQHEFAVTSNPVELEVRALPSQDQPPGFSGAIGRFTLAATATPREAAAGDPITLKLSIKGQGNFNALTAPELTGKDGWRVYPGAADFTPSDDIGFSGEKTFENMLIAVAPKTETPGAEFSYFDPMAEKYVTLTAPPVPVKAQAGKAAAPTGSATPAVAASAAPTPAAVASPVEPGAPSVLPEYRVSSFQSLFHRQEFWIANAAAAVAFLALLAFWLIQRASNSRTARLAQARKQARRLLDEMAGRNLEPAEFCEKGAAFLEARVGSTSLEALAAAGFTGEELAVLQPMLTLRDEARYGVGRSTNALSAEKRGEILNALKQWEARS